MDMRMAFILMDCGYPVQFSIQKDFESSHGIPGQFHHVDLKPVPFLFAKRNDQLMHEGVAGTRFLPLQFVEEFPPVDIITCLVKKMRVIPVMFAGRSYIFNVILCAPNGSLTAFDVS